MDGYKILYNQTVESFEDTISAINVGPSWKNLLKRVPGKEFHSFFALIVDDSIVRLAAFIIDYNDDDTFNFLRIDLQDIDIDRMEEVSGKPFLDLLDDLYKEVGLDGVADVLMI